MRSSTRSWAALAVSALALGAMAAPAGAAKPTRSTVPGSVPRWAQASRDRGDAANKSVTVTVYLPLRDADGAAALAQKVSDPASANYGQYLTPGAFTKQFGPNAADVAAVERFLRGAGLTIGDVPSDNRYVEASGSLAQAEAAFDTNVHRFAYRGRLLDAPTKQLSVPSSLGGKVLAVTGLDQSGTLTKPQNDVPGAAPDKHSGSGSGAGTGAPPPDGFRNAPPCSTYFGEKLDTTDPPVNGKPVPYAPCGYTPSQYQGAYGTTGLLAHGIDGRGVTVAITDAYAAPTILQDANTYAVRHGQAPFRRNQFKQIEPNKPYRYGYDDTVNGDQCGEQGWYGEETLDVEAVHAMAPGANVLYVAGRSCDDPDLLKAINTIVEKRRADIITNSWGDTGEDTPADTLQAYTATFVQAALEGIGVFFSSGDDGDDSGDTEDGSAVVDFPASHPLVTAVGGTALAVTKNNGYGFETGWATGTSTLTDGAWVPPYPGDWLYGGGGGVSSLFAEPFYQFGTVPNAVAKGHRAIPDIAMDGDPQTGMLVGETQTFPDGAYYDEYRIGGTSLSSPLYAGLEALADQAAGHPHGFANPAIYRESPSALNDVKGASPAPAVVRVNYNNSVDASDGTTAILRSLDDEAQSIHLAPGWDTITGRGTPNGAGYVLGLGARGR